MEFPERASYWMILEIKALAIQFNPLVGDIRGNSRKIQAAIERGRQGGADLVVFPELALSGYPPEDLLLLPDFIECVAEELERIIKSSHGIAVVVGLPRRNPQAGEKPLLNSAALINNGKLEAFADKQLLPTYDVFDERRYFEPGKEAVVWEIKGKKIGITICEDLWGASGLIEETRYGQEPLLDLKGKKPSFVLNLSASPYHFQKTALRFAVFKQAAHLLDCPVLMCNQVGGNDSLIFDGHSFCVSGKGLIASAAGFKEEDLWVQLPHPIIEPAVTDPIEELHGALVLGVRDYFHKLGFRKANPHSASWLPLLRFLDF
jgi:NAD+ synthase (glutamine-hydrolysing)